MTRTYDPAGFRRTSPDTKGYPGLTELHRDGRTIQALGSGPHVDAMLQSEMNKDRSGREGVEVG